MTVDETVTETNKQVNITELKMLNTLLELQQQPLHRLKHDTNDAQMDYDCTIADISHLHIEMLTNV